jgi:hypothetical protein
MRASYTDDCHQSLEHRLPMKPVRSHASARLLRPVLRVPVLGLLALTLAACSSGQAPGTASAAADPVVFTFSTVGDSRQDPDHPDPTTLEPPITGRMLAQDHRWLQNSRAWARILRSVEAQRAKLLVVNGDMIMGYGRASVPAAWATKTPDVAAVAESDIARMQRQYAYWRGMVAGLFEAGTYVLPVPGNHELQCSDAITTQPGACRKGKWSQVENEAAWRDNMGDLIVDTERFRRVTGLAASDVRGTDAASAPGAAEGFATDQSQLSYSFDVSTEAGRLHFAVINTYAAGRDGQAPVRWLANDLAQARARGAVRLFVFGHKPARNYNAWAHLGRTLPADGLDPIEPGASGEARSSRAFWQVITDHGATYFAGHQHILHLDRIAAPDAPAGNRQRAAWQVLVGSGGSPFEVEYEGRCPDCRAPSLNEPTDRHYAWATVQVHQSGRTRLEIWGFDDRFGPTRLLAAVNPL